MNLTNLEVVRVSLWFETLLKETQDSLIRMMSTNKGSTQSSTLPVGDAPEIAKSPQTPRPKKDPQVAILSVCLCKIHGSVNYLWKITARWLILRQKMRRIFRPLKKRLTQMKKWRKTFSQCTLEQNYPNMSPHGKGRQKYPRTWTSFA